MVASLKTSFQKMAALSYGKRMLKAGLKKNDPRKRRRLSPEEDAKFYIRSGLDKDGFQVKYISDFKGFGVFAKEQFKKEEFLLEYCGENISPEEAAVRSKKLDCNMIFHFFYKGKQYCIDAASCVDHICQYVNDNNVKDANARMKLLDIDGRPKLCLFATKDIGVGEELSYPYGDDKNLWWRNKIVTRIHLT